MQRYSALVSWLTAPVRRAFDSPPRGRAGARASARGVLALLAALLGWALPASPAAGAECPAAETWGHALQGVASASGPKCPQESEAAAIRDDDGGAGGGGGARARIVERYTYSAYGRVRIWQDGNGNSKLDDTQAGDELTQESQFGNSFMFTGREFDRETGLYYYRAVLLAAAWPVHADGPDWFRGRQLEPL